MTETTHPLPKAGEFWRNKRTGERVFVRKIVQAIDPCHNGVMLTDVGDGEELDLGFRWVLELLNAYERIGTLDEAHAEALAEIDMETCEECKGTGEEAELIDAPDYHGPAKCQGCDGRGLWAKPVTEFLNGSRIQTCPRGLHPDWAVVGSAHSRDPWACPWCLLEAAQEEIVQLRKNTTQIPNPDDKPAMERLYASLGAGSLLRVHFVARSWIYATVKHLHKDES